MCWSVKLLQKPASLCQEEPRMQELRCWWYLMKSRKNRRLDVQFSCSVVSDSLWPYGLQHARPPCPSPTPRAYSCPLSWWCHPTILILSQPLLLPSVVPRIRLFFLMSQFSASGGQSIGVSASASVLPMNIQDWFPLGLTGLTSLLSKGLSRVFSNTTVQNHQFFGAQLCLWSNSHIHTWLLEKP